MKEKKDKPPKSIASQISPGKMIYPILIGFGFVAYMIFNNFDVRAFDALKFTWHSFFWILLAILFMVFRDIGYLIRIRILSNMEFTWKKAFRIIMLWEFTSAITPSAVGGTGLAVIFVTKEGISVGRSTAIVMATSFLDELYFIIMFPLLLLLIKPETLFFLKDGGFSYNIFLIAVIGYTIKFLYVLLVSYGLFINPRGLKKLIVGFFTLRFFRKWRYKAAKAGTEIISSSNELKSKHFSFWLKAFLATAFSWTSRYWVANALFVAFFVVDNHALLFARQLVMWIVMLISPTPGGSGISELAFSSYLKDFLPPVEGVDSLITVLAVLWRLITYYPYLLIGSILVPTWIRNKFVVKEVQ